MTPAAVLLLTLVPSPAAFPQELDTVVSHNGRFAAVLEPSPDPGGGMARLHRRDPVTGALGDEELWRARFALREPPSTFVVSDDGRALCVLERAFSAGHPVARVHRLGREIATRPGSSFSLTGRSLPPDPAQPTTRLWFDERDERPRTIWILTDEGPVQHVRIRTLQESERYVSLETGLVFEGLEGLASSAATPRVENGVTLAEVRPGSLPYVDGVDVPSHAILGQPLRVQVRGNYPTGGFLLEGYALDRPSPNELVLVPASRPPPPGIALTQVLSPFRHAPTLLDLPRGDHVVRARGRSGETPDVVVRVHPRRFEAELAVRGGGAAVWRTVTLYGDGVASLVPRAGAEASHHALPLEVEEDARQALASIQDADLDGHRVDLPPDAASVELVWRSDDGLRRARVPEGWAKGGLLRAVEALERIGTLCATERDRLRTAPRGR